jgi:hypothetical protein
MMDRGEVLKYLSSMPKEVGRDLRVGKRRRLRGLISYRFHEFGPTVRKTVRVMQKCMKIYLGPPKLSFKYLYRGLLKMKREQNLECTKKDLEARQDGKVTTGMAKSCYIKESYQKLQRILFRYFSFILEDKKEYFTNPHWS